MAENDNSVERQRTAIHRIALSRPIRLALQSGLIETGDSVFDYGCGHGDDVRLLSASGIAASGWDPFHRVDANKRPASVVNLGYVLNVIEDTEERRDALVGAWQLAGDLLIVAARTTLEEAEDAASFGDGKLTSRRTFQKFFSQHELQHYIRETIGEEPVAAAPGVFFVFRDLGQRESFLATNTRRVATAPKIRYSDRLYAEHQPSLDSLGDFVRRRGRIPSELDSFDSSKIVERFGSIKRAFLILRRVFSSEYWQNVEANARQDVLVYLALTKFRGRAKFHELDGPLRCDIKALLGSYKKACASADALLFSAGDRQAIDAAFSTSPVGKLTPAGLYVHRTALSELPPVLRIYEGCAQVLIGQIEGANVIKLHRNRFAISYLYYPEFDTDAHPALSGSAIVYLGTHDVRFRDYSEADNPPILHRKETFVAPNYPLREQFAKLTHAEESLGLLDDAAIIGFRQAWQELLSRKGLRISGHEVEDVVGS
jgi:DNA phosphorothioation-associated putative methyltransferase